MSGPRFLYNFTAPRLGVELPLECRREIEAHWQFCAHCGTRLATHCPGCGNPLPPPGAHACPRCGLALPQVSP